MPLFSMPIIVLVEAENFQAAEESLEEWNEELDLDNLPEGTESVNVSPDYEISDGVKILYLPLTEEEDDGTSEDGSSEEDDSFEPPFE